MLTTELLGKLCFSPISVLEPFVDPLNEMMPKWGVDTPLRRAHFIAQACYESKGFSRLIENLNYTDADRVHQVYPSLANPLLYVSNPERLANAVYSGRFGNGDAASNDGWVYRGRGLFQHTFKDNYAELAREIGVDVLTNPDLLCEPRTAILAALYYFKSRGCIPEADDDDTPAVTRKINGGLEGLINRISLKHNAIKLQL